MLKSRYLHHISLLSVFICMTMINPLIAANTVKVRFVTVADTVNKKTQQLCIFQYSLPTRDCKKITVSKQTLFNPADLKYAELRRPRSLTISNAYNEQSRMMPGKVFEDVSIHFVFKDEVLKKIQNRFKSKAGKEFTVIINDVSYLVSGISTFTGNDFVIKKKMDVVLARDIVDSITRARLAANK